MKPILLFLISSICFSPFVHAQDTARKQAREDDGGFFMRIETAAEYTGGSAAWKKYLKRELDDSVAIRNHAPAGAYTVVAFFEIGKDGTVSKVNIKEDPGFGMVTEVTRVLEKSPRWKPATRDGKPVVALHRESFLFKVEQKQ
ncbi:protein TonB [Filimonas zeae]|uniref:TonB C-terminal domain-containing protein n=1 Tax=Filimonas zeae TaxID=1737353 RepID=A0A917MQT0_9BACT|nr:energy transducer TonB [Filimonas zeae]MDR6337423.1 protein TonB [Filimonas zeae]GGH58547.1 hypothetical protein GCM10011379_04370 [Filimonas zeae]